MNTLHLQYVIEVERTRSISQAAENLFIGQPNLSRILHDLEEGVGFRIFERTSRGVRPTERGAKFLQHARGILR
ncbi:MAG: LysR family transcriptional regulator, partial [Oscillospiraceae bacterium]|nr:LysR family transcriptional regulator [Oscillospiraceae bacterium]